MKEKPFYLPNNYMYVKNDMIYIRLMYFDKHVSLLCQTGRKQNFMDCLYFVSLGNPADWFFGSCVFGGLRQCEPV